MSVDPYFTEYPMSAEELRTIDPRRNMPVDVLRSNGILDTLHADALKENDLRDAETWAGPALI